MEHGSIRNLNSESVQIFKTKIWNWEPKDCCCCLYQCDVDAMLYGKKNCL